MNDNDIIKALECCKDRRCGICERRDSGHNEECICRHELIDHALDLIKRQKAEIEQKRNFLGDSLEKIKGLNLKVQLLEQEIKKLQCGGIRADWNKHCERLSSEAIKEFAERLKKHTHKMQSTDFSGEFWDEAVLVEDIDSLVKELTEEHHAETD